MTFPMHSDRGTVFLFIKRVSKITRNSTQAKFPFQGTLNDGLIHFGHDWGAPVAWHAALLRPDRFRGVVGLSVPFIPRGQVYTSLKPPETEDAIFYQEYFQAPGIAEAELERNIRFTIRALLYTMSG